MKKKPTAEEQRNEMLRACQGESAKLRIQRKHERFAARRSIPTEVLATAEEIANNSPCAERDVLADGLRDRPAAWKYDLEEEDSLVEFESVS